MVVHLSERHMHRTRWVLTTLWLLLIVSLFYDPFTPRLTDPANTASPLRLDPDTCVLVQGSCLPLTAYSLGAPIFWGLVVPASIFILLVFGHELWRRICPLSFLSQIPRALGWQRQRKRVSSNGTVRYEIPRVEPDSWLGRHYLYVQFTWFFVGLSSRILFINSDRLALAIWILFTIAVAIGVGYWYGGKSWCHYFCPMAPVQKIYGEPRGLFTSQAHLSESKITQSMCRVVDGEGQEKSACVACQSPCIDIDAERTYWEGIQQPAQAWLYYAYIGLVMGYFFYYYLYAGNWHYYFSGAWAYEPNQWGSLTRPGFYLWDYGMPIPKWVAVPLALGGFTLAGVWLGHRLETWAQQRWGSQLSSETIRHRLLSIGTFFIFNFFFIFAARSWISLLPLALQYALDSLLVLTSAFWLVQTWGRSLPLYQRESLSVRLRKQLVKLNLDWSRYLDHQSPQDLTPDQVYVLAKVLPGFSREKRQQAYKGVLKEALQEGYIESSSSLEVLEQIRSQLELSDDEHRTILSELGVEDPDLLDPDRLHSVENSVRLTGFRKALERLLSLQQRQSITDLLQRDPQGVRRLRQQYCITYEEEEEILWGLDREAGDLHRAKHLLQQLEPLILRYHALNQPQLLPQTLVLNLLRASVRQKKQLLVRGLLELIETTREQDLALRMARELGNLAPTALQDVLNNPLSAWKQRLGSEILGYLEQSANGQPACSLTMTAGDMADHLQALLQDSNPLTQVASLFILAKVDREKAQQQAQMILSHRSAHHPILSELAQQVGKAGGIPLTACPALEKLAYLFNTHFFADIHSKTLLELAEIADFKHYQTDQVVSDEGDTCRELLILIEGVVQVEVERDGIPAVFSLLPGQLLDELEVLSQGIQAGRITAKATPTRILAIPVDAFDAILDRDHDFARRVIKLESARLHQVVGSPLFNG
ncbi:MAG: cyclic nucleotide-binding domain-containing protein [Cyanobacteriota bacterium]|nr:cyclic nucleotide-binding domain-containing protein [Cyanobacteriota bacterium]